MRREADVRIVVPCFNEAGRLAQEDLRSLTAAGVGLVMVDDGSTDRTWEVLKGLADGEALVDTRRLEKNRGKAEAVRLGMLDALDSGASYVGYYDADAATPPEELLRMVEVLRADPRLEAVLGSRVARLGSTISRSPWRHYTGRVYATVASLALGIQIYDTQCGAKVFRGTKSLRAALGRPFPSAWTFDVWLLSRLLNGEDGAAPVAPERLMELPLTRWSDVGESKLRTREAILSVLEIGRLAAGRALRGTGRGRGGPPGRH